MRTLLSLPYATQGCEESQGNSYLTFLHFSPLLATNRRTLQVPHLTHTRRTTPTSHCFPKTTLPYHHVVGCSSVWAPAKHIPSSGSRRHGTAELPEWQDVPDFKVQTLQLRLERKSARCFLAFGTPTFSELQLPKEASTRCSTDSCHIPDQTLLVTHRDSN